MAKAAEISQGGLISAGRVMFWKVAPQKFRALSALTLGLAICFVCHVVLSEGCLCIVGEAILDFLGWLTSPQGVDGVPLIKGFPVLTTPSERKPLCGT